jgi:7-carboxy-7-deazaguanine synthase
MEKGKFPVVEIFGPTLQGEGALAGQPTQFVRFGLCDFRCDFCDSSHAVLPEHVRLAPKMTAEEIADKVAELGSNARWVTLSGGNPAMWDLWILVQLLQNMGYKVAVETQGSLWKPWLGNVDQVTVSPKGPTSKMDSSGLRDFLKQMDSMPFLRYKLALKVVVFNDDDLAYARQVHLAHPGFPFYISIGTRMGGLFGDFAGGAIDTRDDILDRYRWVAERVAADKVFRDTTVLPQLHALIWGHERGH